MGLGERIYQLRNRANLSQSDLAELVGVSRQSVSKWETGTSVPDLEKLVRLSEVFGVSLDMLVLGEEKEPVQERYAAAETGRESAAAAEEMVETLRQELKQQRRPLRQIVGIALLCAAGLLLLLLALLGGALEGLVLAILPALCGALCIKAERPGLWCCWVAFGWWAVVSPYFMGVTSPLTTLRAWRYFGTVPLLFSGICLLLILALTFWTVKRYYQYPSPHALRNFGLTVAAEIVLAILPYRMMWEWVAYVLFALMCLFFAQFLYQRKQNDP